MLILFRFSSLYVIDNRHLFFNVFAIVTF